MSKVAGRIKVPVDLAFHEMFESRSPSLCDYDTTLSVLVTQKPQVKPAPTSTRATTSGLKCSPALPPNMHLDEAESELLKKWTVKKLEDISDADSDVLADYVLALAKTDDPEPVAKANCIENLKDFLVDKTERFVNDLFQAIATKSYDPSRPPPKPAASVYQPPKRPSVEHQSLPNESRKRSYHDWDGEDQVNGNGRIQSYERGERPMKQPRRGGRGYDQRGGRQSYPQGQQMPPMPPMPTPPPGMPPLDPNNPMAALLAMQQAMGFFAGLPNGGSPPNVNAFAPPRTGQRCRDYDTKGFCSAGASCPYEHGNDPYVVAGQEYDPNNATLLNVAPSRVGHVNAAPNNHGRGAARGRGRGGGNWRGGGKRSDFSYAGPIRDKSITSIVVEQIPEEQCDEDTVREFFSEFGEVEDVNLQADKKLAILKFGSHGAARAAYESPKVVFDNRFVKVYWYRPEKMTKPRGEAPESMNGKRKPEDIDVHDNDQIDPAELAKRQEEAQRKHDEAKRQREEAAKQKQDLDAKLMAMEAERKKMADILAKKSGKAASPTVESPNPSAPEESEQTKALKAQLAKLEAEAKSLGIDPDAPTNGFSNSPGYRGRGGYRGRAQGRSSYPSYRGAWAGGDGRGGAVMRLDNRTKTVAVTFAEGSYETHDEALRQFLLFNSLDSASIAKHPERDDTALVTFNQRFEGENFMMAAAGNEVLHIGKVDLSWYNLTNGTVTADGSNGIDTKMDTAETSEQQQAAAPDGMAYDAADEEDLDRWS